MWRQASQLPGSYQIGNKRYYRRPGKPPVRMFLSDVANSRFPEDKKVVDQRGDQMVYLMERRFLRTRDDPCEVHVFIFVTQFGGEIKADEVDGANRNVPSSTFVTERVQTVYGDAKHIAAFFSSIQEEMLAVWPLEVTESRGIPHIPQRELVCGGAYALGML